MNSKSERTLASQSESLRHISSQFSSQFDGHISNIERLVASLLIFDMEEISVIQSSELREHLLASKAMESSASRNTRKETTIENIFATQSDRQLSTPGEIDYNRFSFSDKGVVKVVAELFEAEESGRAKSLPPPSRSEGLSSQSVHKFSQTGRTQDSILRSREEEGEEGTFGVRKEASGAKEISSARGIFEAEKLEKSEALSNSNLASEGQKSSEGLSGGINGGIPQINLNALSFRKVSLPEAKEATQETQELKLVIEGLREQNQALADQLQTCEEQTRDIKRLFEQQSAKYTKELQTLETKLVSRKEKLRALEASLKNAEEEKTELTFKLREALSKPKKEPRNNMMPTVIAPPAPIVVNPFGAGMPFNGTTSQTFGGPCGSCEKHRSRLEEVRRSLSITEERNMVLSTELSVAQKKTQTLEKHVDALREEFFSLVQTCQGFTSIQVSEHSEIDLDRTETLSANARKAQTLTAARGPAFHLESDFSERNTFIAHKQRSQTGGNPFSADGGRAAGWGASQFRGRSSDLPLNSFSKLPDRGFATEEEGYSVIQCQSHNDSLSQTEAGVERSQPIHLLQMLYTQGSVIESMLSNYTRTNNTFTFSRNEDSLASLN